MTANDEDIRRTPGAAVAAALGRTSAASAPDLRPLAGVRTVSSIGVVVLHCYMYWQIFLPDHATKYELTRSNPVIKLASAGMAWVDVLLVLSATLAAYQLLPRLQDARPGASSCRAVVLRYWRGRAARILPGYLAANLLAAVALGPANAPKEVQAARWINFFHCPRTLWANLLLVQNWMGTQACATHLWTVALQAQFFFAFPLLLLLLRPRRPGFGARLAAALAAVSAAGTAWRLWAAWQVDFLELPIANFAVDHASQLSWANMLTASYLPTASRAAQLAGGAALGAALRSQTALRWAHRRRVWLAAAALGLQAAYAHLLLRRHLLFRAPGGTPWPLAHARLHIALLSWGGPLVTVLVCATLAALALHADPLHTAAARVLRLPCWRPLADLSYGQYLLHEHARLWGLLLLPHGLVPSLILNRPVLGFAAVAAGTLAAGYAAAAALQVLVQCQRSKCTPASKSAA